MQHLQDHLQQQHQYQHQQGGGTLSPGHLVTSTADLPAESEPQDGHTAAAAAVEGAVIA
jgi:hypothetical protein